MNSKSQSLRSVIRPAALLGALCLLATGPRLRGADAAVAALAPSPQAMQAGKRVFQQICFACHQSNGQGLAGMFPPLARSDFLLSDADRAVRILLHGRQGPITVNGRSYNNVMPQLHLDDRQIADVLTYVLNSWGNAGAPVAVADVARLRQSYAAK